MNADPFEIKKFSDIAHHWWDQNSEFRPLHEINPLRLEWINVRTPLAGKKVIDVGCGGGILTESMAKKGADVTGIDLSVKAIKVADLHSLESNLNIRYQLISAEQMLEHVPTPSSIIQSCAQLVKPGGYVFFSTINRNPKAYLQAILGAEYLLNILPKGTHDYAKFITPAELSQYIRQAGLDLLLLSGMGYNPVTKMYSLHSNADVNFLAACQRAI